MTKRNNKSKRKTTANRKRSTARVQRVVSPQVAGNLRHWQRSKRLEIDAMEADDRDKAATERALAAAYAENVCQLLVG